MRHDCRYRTETLPQACTFVDYPQTPAMDSVAINQDSSQCHSEWQESTLIPRNRVLRGTPPVYLFSASSAWASFSGGT